MLSKQEFRNRVKEKIIRSKSIFKVRFTCSRCKKNFFYNPFLFGCSDKYCKNCIKKEVEETFKFLYEV